MKHINIIMCFTDVSTILLRILSPRVMMQIMSLIDEIQALQDALEQK